MMGIDIIVIKAIHIIFVITWFAGLFYIGRLFIYHAEAEQRPEIERKILQQQYKIMEKRLWYVIAYPSMLITLITGFILVYSFNYWLQPWMIVKFALVAGLVLYHLQCGRIFSRFQRDEIKYAPFVLRLWNELATVLLIAIVFVIVLKGLMDWRWGGAGFGALMIILYFGIRAYRKK